MNFGEEFEENFRNFVQIARRFFVSFVRQNGDVNNCIAMAKASAQQLQLPEESSLFLFPSRLADHNDHARRNWPWIRPCCAKLEGYFGKRD